MEDSFTAAQMIEYAQFCRDSNIPSDELSLNMWKETYREAALAVLKKQRAHGPISPFFEDGKGNDDLEDIDFDDLDIEGLMF